MDEQTNLFNNDEINDWRMKINTIDAKIIALIAKRHDLSRQIGEYKLKAGLPIYNETRELELMALHESLSIKYNIPIAHIAELFHLIMQQSKSLQNKS